MKNKNFTAHESCFIEKNVQIGHGTKIWHFSHIMKGAQIGDNCILGQNVFIGSKVKIHNGVKIQNNVSVYDAVILEDFVFCGPSMVFTNVINPRSEIERKNEYKETRVKKGATLGANCTIVCGITIGQYAFIGAGAVVTKNIPDYALVYGNPARQHGWICSCGQKIDKNINQISISCSSCQKQYTQTDNQLSPKKS